MMMVEFFVIGEWWWKLYLKAIHVQGVDHHDHDNIVGDNFVKDIY